MRQIIRLSSDDLESDWKIPSLSSRKTFHFLLACGFRRFCTRIFLQGAKKRLDDAHCGSVDFAYGRVGSHGLLSVDGLVGVVVQLEDSSIEGNPGKQTFGAGIRVDRRI